MNQNDLRKKISRFIKNDIKKDSTHLSELNNKKELYDIFHEYDGGSCQGLAGLWLLSKKLKDEKIQDSKILKFENIQNMLINWDGKEVFSAQDKKDIYEYLNFLCYVQKTDNGQKELYQIIHDSVLGIPKMEINKSGVFSKKQIIQIFKKYLKPGKMISLGMSKHFKHGHATALYMSKANEIFYFDSNFDKNECHVENIEEAVEKFYQSSNYLLKFKEYNKDIDEDLKEFQIVISDFSEIPKGPNSASLQNIDNLINIFSDEKRIEKYYEFDEMQKNYVIDFIVNNPNLYSEFADDLEFTLKLQIATLKLNDNNIFDFINKDFIKDNRIKRLVFEIYCLQYTYEKPSPIHDAFIEFLFFNNKETGCDFSFFDKSVEGKYKEHYLKKLETEISFYQKLKFYNKEDVSNEIISELTQKTIKLAQYLDLRTIVKIIALNDFNPDLIQTLFNKCVICKDKDTVSIILELILSGIDIDKNLNNIQILLMKCFEKFNISLDYIHLFDLHNNNLNNFVLNNFLKEPKDDNYKILLNPLIIHTINTNTFIFKQIIELLKKTKDENNTNEHEQHLKIFQFLNNNYNLIKLNIGDLIIALSLINTDNEPSDFLNIFSKSSLGYKFNENLNKALLTIIEDGRSNYAAKLIKGLALHQKHVLDIDDIMKYKNLEITQAIIETKENPETFVQENFYKFFNIHEPYELIRIHPVFIKVVNKYIEVELFKLNYNEHNNIQQEKLLYLKSIIDSTIETISIDTIIYFLNFTNDLNIARNYIMNCSDNLNEDNLKLLSTFLFNYRNANKNFNEEYFILILDMLTIKFGESIIIRLLTDFIKKENSPCTYNHIKNIFFNNIINSSQEIDLDFIKKHMAFLSIDSIIKIIFDRKINKTKICDFITECNYDIDQEIIENLTLYLYKYYYEEEQKNDELLKHIFKIIQYKFKDNNCDSLFIGLLEKLNKESFEALHNLIKNTFLLNKLSMQQNLTKEFIIENQSILDIISVLDFILQNTSIPDNKIEELFSAFEDIDDEKLDNMVTILINYFYNNSENNLFLKKIINILDLKFKNKLTSKINKIAQKQNLESVIIFLGN